jgi:hypothetical protein
MLELGQCDGLWRAVVDDDHLVRRRILCEHAVERLRQELARPNTGTITPTLQTARCVSARRGGYIP